MMKHRFFFNRRSGTDRRQAADQRKNPRLDLSHKRRRKTTDRRRENRSMSDDFYASNNFFNRGTLTDRPDKH